MPTTSERQRRAMYAAASGHSTLGIPAEVGREFVGVDSAGIVYSTPAGKHLLGKRGDNAPDHPGAWAFPGGKIEADETPKQAAVREFYEETGFAAPLDDMVHLGNSGNFAVFHVIGDAFEPAGDGENAAFSWVDANDLPADMHPGAVPAMAHPEVRAVGANELELARMMAAGSIASPQAYGNVVLIAMRITGTGVCYRMAREEFAWRDPAEYLNDEFMARCNGLPVIWQHPGAGVLDTDEYRDRVVGAIMLPYIKGSEVWGVAKLHDMDAAQAIATEQHSTSPSVVTSGDAVLTLADGQDIVIEGKPKLVDHLAICAQGVWDKGGPPQGVISTDNEVAAMADKDEEMQKKVDELQAKVDAFEAKAKADAEEKAKVDAEMADKAKADAEKAEAEEKAKADSVAGRIADIEARLPGVLADAELEAIAEAQAKADSVFAALGERTPRPLPGERVDRFRARLLGKLQAHSAKWSKVDLAKADAAVLDIAEPAVYADALAASNSPSVIGAGRLVERSKRTGAGHTMIEFSGDNGEYLASFASKPQRVTGFKTGV